MGGGREAAPSVFKGDIVRCRTLAELKAAFEKGELDREKHKVDVDNDCVSLYAGDESVFDFEGRPEYLLVEALKLLGIPAEHV